MKMSKLLFRRESPEIQPLRNLIERVSHRVLILWVIDCAEHLLAEFISEEEVQRPWEAIKAAKEWSLGNIKMAQAKVASKATHQCARELSNLGASAMAHGMGHVIGTVHVETHALGFIIYALTAMVNRDQGSAQIQDYLAWFSRRLLFWEELGPDSQQKWASFLQKDRFPNKERLLHERLNR